MSIVKSAKTSDFNLSGIWPHYSFWGCKTCLTQEAPLGCGNDYPVCPKCKSRMEIISVSQSDFSEWLKIHSVLINLLETDKINYNELMRRAEKEISYSAKRAIEMYIPVWEKEPSWGMFKSCAKYNALCQGEIEQCQCLMREYGMVEEKDIGKCEPLKE